MNRREALLSLVSVVPAASVLGVAASKVEAAPGEMPVAGVSLRVDRGAWVEDLLVELARASDDDGAAYQGWVGFQTSLPKLEHAFTAVPDTSRHIAWFRFRELGEGCALPVRIVKERAASSGESRVRAVCGGPRGHGALVFDMGDVDQAAVRVRLAALPRRKGRAEISVDGSHVVLDLTD